MGFRRDWVVISVPMSKLQHQHDNGGSMGLPTPQVPDPMSVPPKRWAILGTGWIAAQFVSAMRASTRQQVVAVGSRSIIRAREFASEHHIPNAYGSYEELVAADVDVVYVATGHLDHLYSAS